MPPNKPRPRSRLTRFLVSRLTSWKLLSGLGLIALGTWLSVSMHSWDMDRSKRLIPVMIILFIVGGISCVNGLCDGNEE
jgi:hypothetical protein